MAKEYCFVCGNKLGILMKWSLKELKKEEPPPNMSTTDKICDKCKDNLPKRDKVTNLPKGSGNPTSTSKAVHYKDSKCAVLILFASGNYDEFNREFSKLTSEGYELKTSYVPPASLAGFSIALGSFFYFQKLENKSTESNVSAI